MLLVVVTLAGCGGEPPFNEYRGNNSVRVGTGGSVRAVKGIDVWETGTPDRPYQILGDMESYGGRFSSADFETEQIAKAAKRKGADAIILIDSDNGGWGAEGREEDGGWRADFGNYRPSAAAVLIRYLPTRTSPAGAFDDLIPKGS